MKKAEFQKAISLLSGQNNEGKTFRFQDGTKIINFGAYFSFRSQDGSTIDTGYRVEDFAYAID